MYGRLLRNAQRIACPQRDLLPRLRTLAPRAFCGDAQVRGKTYYVCGSAWFQPSFGANGGYSRVVPAP